MTLCRSARSRLTPDAIDTATPHHLSLSTALRLFVLGYYRDAATETGHIAAGHGNVARRH
jgi:hypothetical protein